MGRAFRPEALGRWRSARSAPAPSSPCDAPPRPRWHDEQAASALRRSNHRGARYWICNYASAFPASCLIRNFLPDALYGAASRTAFRCSSAVIASQISSISAEQPSIILNRAAVSWSAAQRTGKPSPPWETPSPPPDFLQALVFDSKNSLPEDACFCPARILGCT